MRVLGIDPGSLVTGFGVVEEQANRLHVLAWGAIRTTPRQPLYERLRRIYDGLSEAVGTWKPHAVSVERVFFAENPKTALTLGHARGVALLTVAHASLPLVEYTALEIKKPWLAMDMRQNRKCSGWCKPCCVWTPCPSPSMRPMRWPRPSVTCIPRDSSSECAYDCSPAGRSSRQTR